MHRLTVLLVLLLSACVQGAPHQVAAFRPNGAPIWSAAAFEPSRLDGDWLQVAAFSTLDSPGCTPGGAAFRRGPSGLTVTATLCLNGEQRTVAGPVSVAGPGRIGVPGMADWWVIWVDSGYRTLAIGTPDGTFGFVLDRGRTPADRLAAAAEIFDFNGYIRGLMKPF